MMQSNYENKAFGMTNTVTLENKSKVTLNGLKPGAKITLQADENGLPTGVTGQYWRKVLKDAEVDGCVEVVKSKKGAK